MTQLVSKAVGIDLGTTNSAVAIADPADGDIVIHRDPNTKSRTTPSCVWRDSSTGELVVGRKAVARKGGTPEPVSSIKRLMGTRSTVRLAGETLTPQQVSAFILAEMKRQIEGDVASFDGPSSRWLVDRAIVTVPAYFDQPQIDATREAAELAGLEVLGLLHEPTAAASYHCWRTATRDGTFLVYDLGGGTFDVSVLRCTAGSFEVLGISGNNRLGGDDIDTALARHLQQMLLADDWKLDLDLEHDEEDRARFTRLKVLAEGAKKTLSDLHEVTLRDSGLLIDKAGVPVVIDTMLERSEIERIARPFVERTFLYCDEALARAEERAGITLADVDQVILAGGSTHMPLVRELVAGELCGHAAPDSPRQQRAKCQEPVYEEVDTVVALGAAVRAAAVGGLMLYDEARTVRVSLRGTGRTSASQVVVGGTAEAVAHGVDLAGGRVMLTAGGYEDEADLAGNGSFSFTRIPVQPDAKTEFRFDVLDAAGEPRATVRRLIEHGEDRTPLATDPVTLNSKAIKLEVRRAEQDERYPIVPALELLPFARDYEFRHPGGGVETVELRLYQESRPIQVVSVKVPKSTPAGTPIRMHLVMHENYAITVQGSIGDTPYQAQVHLPMDRDMPSEEEIARLVRRFEENAGALPIGKRTAAKARFTMARRAFGAARDAGDVQQAIHERDEMESVVDSIEQTDAELQPPKPTFDQLTEACTELHAHYARHGVPAGRPFDADELAKSIEEHRLSGEKAYINRDQRSYGEAARGLRGILEFLMDLDRPEQPDTLTDADRAQAMVDSNKATAAQLRPMARNARNAAADGQLAEIAERITRLEPQIATNPRRVLDESGKIAAKLRQIRATLEDRGDAPGIPVIG
jgi:molecular chaperone DnaK